MKLLLCLVLIVCLFSFVKSDCSSTLNNVDAYSVHFTYSGVNSTNPFDNYVPKGNYFLKNAQIVVDRVNQLRYVYYEFDDAPYTFESWLYVNNNTYYILDTSKHSGCQYRFGTPSTNQVVTTNYTYYSSDMVGSIKAQVLLFDTPNQFDQSGYLYVDPNDCSPIFQNGINGGGNSLVTYTSYTQIQPSIDYFYLPSQCAHAHLIV